MSTFRQLVYLVLDEIKTVSDDSMITEEHVIFLANHYRALLLQQKLKQGQLLSQTNSQTICLDLQKAPVVQGAEMCYGEYLKSVQKIPDTISGSVTTASAGNQFFNNITLVSKNRFNYVGYNKYLRNIIYATIGDDDYLYLKSNNPQFMYLNKVQVSGVFEDSEEAAKLSCDINGKQNCEIWDKEFPIESSLFPQLTQLIVRDLLGAAWRASNDINNAQDDLANLIAYIRKNTKNNLQKQMEADNE